jgi:uncharacterized membrane protein YbhN (UPF0104 family)
MRIPNWVRIAFSAAVVVFILWRVPADALLAAFQNIDPHWLRPALASSFATLAVRALKWQRLLRSANSSTLPRDARRSLFAGFALGIITPGRLGEFGRCLFMPVSERSRVLPLNIVDRVLDSWSVATFAVVSLFLVGHQSAGIFATAIWLAFLPIILGLPRLVSNLGAAEWWSDSIRAQFRDSHEALGNIQIVPYAAWALVSTSFDILTFFFLLRAFHPTAFTTAVATFPWIVMASGIPLSIGGLGLREGAATLLLAHSAIPAAVATDVSLFLFAFLGLLPAFIGGTWLLVGARVDELKPGKIRGQQLGNNLGQFRMSEE